METTIGFSNQIQNLSSLTEFFEYTKVSKEECPIDKCSINQNGNCNSPLEELNLFVVKGTTWDLHFIPNVSEGQEIKACVRCEIQNFIFDFDGIVVRQPEAFNGMQDKKEQKFDLSLLDS